MNGAVQRRDVRIVRVGDREPRFGFERQDDSEGIDRIDLERVVNADAGMGAAVIRLRQAGAAPAATRAFRVSITRDGVSMIEGFRHCE